MNSIIASLALFLVSGTAYSAVSSEFREEAATVKGLDGVPLSARWTFPPTAPKGVVVLLQGSGNVAMDGDVSSPFIGFPVKGKTAKLSEQLAATFAAQGIASLRFSKRGVDDSAELKNQTLPYLVNDALAALSQARGRFPGLKIGFAGFSEGSYVAVLAASEVPVDALFLLSPVTRHLDEVFVYQYLSWPVDLIRNRLDVSPRDGEISSAERFGVATPPLLGLFFPPEQSTWKALDTDKDDSVSVTRELVPAYQNLTTGVLGLMKTPAFAGWYNSFEKAASYSEFAGKIKAPVYLYQSFDDSQLDWRWIVHDRAYFGGGSKIRYFSGVGHCFSPFDGNMGEIKTSGPYDDSVLGALKSDALEVF